MHRVLFKIGSFEVYTYGFTLVLGFIIAIAVTMYRNRNRKIQNEDFLDFSFYLLIAGIIGSRLVYVLLHLNEYLSRPLSMFNLREGGLAWHGAMAGGLIAFLVFSRKKKIDLYELLDLAAPQMMLGLAIGRIGCFMNGCCLGNETTLPWGVVFRDAGFTTPRHPTQLYELFLDLLIFSFLVWWDKKKKFSGEILILMLTLYSAARFMVEFFRWSPPYVYGLSYAQYFSAVFIGACFYWIYQGRRKGTLNVLAGEKKPVKERR